MNNEEKNKIHLILSKEYNYYNNKSLEEQKKIINDYAETGTYEQIERAIKKIGGKYIPTLAEIRNVIADTKNISKLNLNSSYWYTNLRNAKDYYYDITNGKRLDPYKGV